MSQQLSFALGGGVSGVPLNAVAYQSLMSAMQGGQATAAYMQQQTTVQNFFNWLKTEGSAAWVSSTNAVGLPVLFAAQRSGSESISLVVSPNVDQAVVNGQTPPSSMTVNSDTYDVVGSVTVSLEYGETSIWLVEFPLGALTRLGIRALAGVAWADFLQPMLAGISRSISLIGANAGEGGGAAAEGLLAQQAAEEGGVDGAAVGADTLTFVIGAAATAAIVVLAALPAVLQVIAHPTYQGLQVVNLTPYQITWAIADQAHGAVAVEPAAGSGDPSTVIPPSTPVTNGGATTTVAPMGQFAFASQSEVSGIGYVMTFVLADPMTGETIDTAGVMFDIPFSGDNSLAVTTGGVSDPSGWYSDTAGKNQATQQQSRAPSYTITATYDYLDGEHPGPSGQMLYWYNSMVFFTNNG